MVISFSSLKTKHVDNANKVKKLTERSTKDIYAFHGSNLDAVIKMIETSYLMPGRFDPPKLFIVKNELKEAEFIAEAYAEANSQTHQIMKRMHAKDSDFRKVYQLWSLYNIKDDDYKEEFEFEDLLKELSEKYKREEKLINVKGQKSKKRISGFNIKILSLSLAAAEAVPKKGCLLTLSKKIEEDFQLFEAKTPNSYYISIPKGLNLDYIAKIELLSSYEINFFTPPILESDLPAYKKPKRL